MTDRFAREDGAVLIIVSISLVVLAAVAALAIDIAGVRADRSLAGTVTDNAVAAAALDLEGGDGQTACETALAYLALNMPAEAFSGADCTTLPTSCGAATAPVSTTATSGRWTATITYPVPDGDPQRPAAASLPREDDDDRDRQAGHDEEVLGDGHLDDLERRPEEEH